MSGVGPRFPGMHHRTDPLGVDLSALEMDLGNTSSLYT